MSADDRTALEIEKLRLEINNLRVVLADLQSESRLAKNVKRYQPVLAAVVGVLGFLFGVYQYASADAASRDQRKQTEEARIKHEKETEEARLEQQEKANKTFRLNLKRETAKPLWDRQLGLYIDATEAAATIATTHDPEKRKTAETRFWVLYWGSLAAVEDVGLVKGESAEIEKAMVAFGQVIKRGETDRDVLQGLSLKLARAVRTAITPAFDVEATPINDSLRKGQP